MKKQTKQTKRTKKGKGIMDVATPIANRAVAVGKIYKGDLSGFKSLLPNLSDSMSQLDPSSSDFNIELWNMLTPQEQAQAKIDKLQTMTNPLNIIPFIGLFQDTREAVAETLGMRHPELLKKAIDRYNEKIQSDAEMYAIQEQAYADQAKQYEKDQDSKQMEDMLTRIVKVNQQAPQFNQSFTDIPHTVPPNQSFPADITRGRGLYTGGCGCGCKRKLIHGGSLYMLGVHELPYEELYTVKY